MSVASETENPIHFISHIHDGDTVYSKFECKAGDQASCHHFPECDCEAACEHPEVQQDDCWAKEWMDDVCSRECFAGPKDTEAHSGPIFVSFNGDCVEWEYL